MGIHTGSAEYARGMVAKGMQLLTFGSDARLLAAAAQRTVVTFRNVADEQATPAY